MTPQLLITALIAAAGFGAGWQIQAWRQNEKEKDHAEQKLVEVRQSAAADIRRLDNTITAQRAATAREVALRRDRDSANSQLDRLRDTLRATVPGVGAATATCPERADPARELLAACATELVEMGGIADRHASDAQSLMDAWPK